MKFKAVLALITVLVMSLSQAALAHIKSDVITLYNGDRVTGEIKSLYGGLIEHKTDSMGTIKIEWQEVASVESRFHYEVRTSDGQRFFGSLGKADLPGTLRLDSGEGVQDFEWLQVVELRPVEDTLLSRVEIYLSAGYSYTKASSVAETTLNTNISYEDARTRNTLSGRTIITDTDDEDTSSNRYELSRYIWRDRSDFFRSVTGSYEDNDELELDHRISLGTGLGRYFLDTHRMRFLGGTGLQVTSEKPTGADRDENIELFINTQFAMWRFTTPELDLNLGFNLYPSITEWGRVRSDTDLRLRWELLEDLFFDITAWATSDNEAESDNKVDYGVTTGIGWEW